MPVCKNDPKSHYTGEEPSPKGLGYCAHAEKVGKTMKGKDGNMWIIVQVKGGTVRWSKSENKTTKIRKSGTKIKTIIDAESIHDSIARSRKESLKMSRRISKQISKVKPMDDIPPKGKKLPLGQIVNLRWPTKGRGHSDKRATIGSFKRAGGVYEIFKLKNGYYYARKLMGDKMEFKVPINATYTRLNPTQRARYIKPDLPIERKIDESICPPHKNNDLKITIKNSYFTSTEIKNTQDYRIHDNGGRPFKVLICNKAIEIYITKPEPQYDEEQSYNHMIKRYTKYKGVWIGYDSGDGRPAHGNSILIQISDKEYVYIGSTIYSFETDEKILNYVSPVGNSDVPYPVAYGEKNAFFMLDGLTIALDSIDIEPTIENGEDMYGIFYGHIESKKKLEHTKGMKKVKIVHKRLW